MLELQSVQNEQRKGNQVKPNDSKTNINNNNNNNNKPNGGNSACDLGATTVTNEFVAIEGDGTVVALNGQNTIKKYGNDAQSDDDNDDDDDDDDDDTTRIEQSQRQNNYNINNNIVAIGSDAEQSCDTISISTVDTNNSSTNSIITVTNSDGNASTVDRSDISTENSSDTSTERTEQQLNAINGSHSGEKLSIDKWLGQQNAPKKYTSRLSGSKAAAIAAELAAAGLFEDEPAPVKRTSCENVENRSAHGTDINSAYDYADEKEALESFDRIIEEECKLINETDILREEELVELKERCIKLTDDNLSLRKEVEHLRLNSNKQITLLMYTAPLAVLIGYLFSLIFS